MAKRNPTHWHQNATPLDRGYCLHAFREDQGIDWNTPLDVVGCIDAPDYLPAGCTYRFLNIDKVAEIITGWPATRRAPRGGAK